MSSTSLPTITEQRALAYAQKPFAILSFLACTYGIYYLLVKRPEKRKRLYHRLMLAIFICFLPLSIVLFIGTWAMPTPTPWAVGEKGNKITCDVQGFIFSIFYLAFPFYYASLSIYAYVALRNNFQEEKYVWIEKWIHLGAYALPLALAITALAMDGYSAALGFCRNDMHGSCDIFNDAECHHSHAKEKYSAFVFIIGIELLVGTVTIVVLLCTFEKIQRKHDDAIGMTRLLEKARKRRLKEVAWQTGLYLASFWFGYFPKIIDRLIRIFNGSISYNLVIVSDCIFSFQGFIIMVIYFVLQSRSNKEAQVENIIPDAPDSERNDTVTKIRENAAKPKRPSMRNSIRAFSFRIFDGTPADDSPFREYFEDAVTERDTVIEESAETETNNLTTSLLAEESTTQSP